MPRMVLVAVQIFGDDVGVMVIVCKNRESQRLYEVGFSVFVANADEVTPVATFTSS